MIEDVLLRNILLGKLKRRDRDGPLPLGPMNSPNVVKGAFVRREQSMILFAKSQGN